MPIQLRLAIAFGLAAAALFVLGGWLFASGLSSAQLKTIASQLAAPSSSPSRAWARTGWRARPCLQWSGCGGRWPRCPNAVRRRAPESRPSRFPATRDEVAALADTMNDLLGRLQPAPARQRAFV